MDVGFHSVTLDASQCKGCINCIKRCPTEAIRVRSGKAQILSERCIDCGECIRVCPHHAKKAVFDPLSAIHGFKHKIALPAPALYGQFNNLDDIDYVLTGLKRIGFDDVFEVSRAAELVSEATRDLMNRGEVRRPVISSACPVIERLIRIRFPSLCPNVLPLLSPMEAAARMAKERAVSRLGFAESEVGVFFISPCPAKVTDVKRPIGCRKSAVDGVLSMSAVYPELIGAMKKIDEPEALARSGIIGVSWAGSGGESSALLSERYLAADGIENVIKVLEEIEDEKLNHLSFIELNACPGGCVGGALTVENPYVAKARLQILRKWLPVAKNHLEGGVPDDLRRETELTPLPGMQLSDDMNEAMRMLNEIEEIHARLPGLDCGSCGAPTCRDHAEDIVLGRAKEADCVFRLREKIRALARSFTAEAERIEREG